MFEAHKEIMNLTMCGLTWLLFLWCNEVYAHVVRLEVLVDYGVNNGHI